MLRSGKLPEGQRFTNRVDTNSKAEGDAGDRLLECQYNGRATPFVIWQMRGVLMCPINSNIAPCNGIRERAPATQDDAKICTSTRNDALLYRHGTLQDASRIGRQFRNDPSNAILYRRLLTTTVIQGPCSSWRLQELA